MPAVSVLIKPASSLCNMSCDYCFYCDESQKRSQSSFGFMDDKTLKNTIRKTMLQAENAITYAFQGGEPTLCGIDFFQRAIAYQKQYNKNHITVHNSLQTNGYALDEAWCGFLHENNFLVGLSVDGIAKVHNAVRHSKNGDDTFDRVLHSARLMDQYHVNYNILTVVTSMTAKNISEIYYFYQKQGWKYQQYIACLDPLDEVHGLKFYSLTPELYGQFLIELFHLWYEDFKHGNHPYIRQFENYVGLAAGFIPEACDQLGICGIQNIVEADGSVYPCDFYVLDQYRLGNFNDNLLYQINQKRSETGFIERSHMLDYGCTECPYYRLCRGGCQRCRDFNQNTGLYSNYFCPSYKMFFDECFDKIVKIAKISGLDRLYPV